MLAIGAFVFYGWYTQKAEEAKVIHLTEQVSEAQPADPEPEQVKALEPKADTNIVRFKVSALKFGGVGTSSSSSNGNGK
ncbi:MAG: hypothetical protein Q7R78_01745 [bacterium]|nr:hypothetical protein [bacterium]